MHNRTIYKRVNHYVMEAILLYLVLFIPYYGKTVLPPVGSYLLIIGLGGLVFSFVLAKLKNGSSTFLFVLIIPIFVFFGIKLDLSLIMSLFLSSFAAWRVYVLTVNEPNFTDDKLLATTFWVGFFVYIGALIQHYPYRNAILILIISQLPLLSTRKIVTAINQSAINRKITLIQYPVIILFFTSIGLISFFGMKIVSKLLNIVWVDGISIFITKIMYYISIPVLYVLELLLPKPKEHAVENKSTNVDDPMAELRKKAAEQGYDPDIYTILGIIVVVILAIVVITYFIRKKAAKATKEENKGSPVRIQTKKAAKNYFSTFKRKQKSPENKIRKLIFDLERKAEKINRGRYHYETIEEWLTREMFLNERLVEVYSKVRYGEATPTESEYEQCVAIVASLQESIQKLKNG